MVLKLNISHYYQQYVSECDAPFKAVFKYKWFNTSKIFLLQMDSRGGPKSPQACEYDFSNCFPNLTTFHHFHFTASVRATSERLGCSSGLAGLPSPNSFAQHVVLATQPKDPVRNVCRVASVSACSPRVVSLPSESEAAMASQVCPAASLSLSPPLARLVPVSLVSLLFLRAHSHLGAFALAGSAWKTQQDLLLCPISAQLFRATL